MNLFNIIGDYHKCDNTDICKHCKLKYSISARIYMKVKYPYILYGNIPKTNSYENTAIYSYHCHQFNLIWLFYCHWNRSPYFPCIFIELPFIDCALTIFTYKTEFIYQT